MSYNFDFIFAEAYNDYNIFLVNEDIADALDIALNYIYLFDEKNDTLECLHSLKVPVVEWLAFSVVVYIKPNVSSKVYKYLEYVENPEYQLLLDDCSRTLFHYIECHFKETHSISFKAYQAALSLGINLPMAKPESTLNQLANCYGYKAEDLGLRDFSGSVNSDLSNLIVVPYLQVSALYAVLQHFSPYFFVTSDAPIHLCHRDYPWHTQLDTRKFDVFITGIDPKTSKRIALTEDVYRRYPRLAIELELINKTNPAERYCKPLPYHFDMTNNKFQTLQFGDVQLFLNPAFESSMDDIVKYLSVCWTVMNSYVDTSERSEFMWNARKIAAKVILSPEDYGIYMLEKHLEHIGLKDYIPDGCIATLELENGKPKIRLQNKKEC